MAATYNYTRVRPNDLNDVLLDQGSDITVADSIGSIQAHYNRTYACPKCQVSNLPTGWNNIVVDEQTFKVVCTVCEGFLKTVQVWIPDPANATNFVALYISGTSPLVAGTSGNFTASVAGGVWASSDETKATITANSGAISAIAAGTTNITYTIGNYVATFPLTVSPGA